MFSSTRFSKTEKVDPVYSIVTYKSIEVHPASFPDGISAWPICATQRGFRSGKAVSLARLLGLRAILPVRLLGLTKKSPDAVFRGGVALLGRA